MCCSRSSPRASRSSDSSVIRNRFVRTSLAGSSICPSGSLPVPQRAPDACHDVGMPELDEARVDDLIDRAYALAGQEMAGIDDAARELARTAGGSVEVVAAAIRRIRAALGGGSDHATKQVASLLRRALEIGEWDWQ